MTRRLEELGAVIYEGHEGEQVMGSDVVVISSAVAQENVEVKSAHEYKIPVIRRAEMLGELMRMKQGVAIAGTHGKTTTSSMVGLMMQAGGLDPTLIIGGKIRSLRSNAKLGTGDYMVVEADEYDRSFLQLTPTLAAITNIESDHLDCYDDLDAIKEAFISFANKVPFHGAVCVCLDEKALQDIIPYLHRRLITYGLTPQAEVRAVDIQYRETASQFTALSRDQVLGTVHLQMPGEHNVKNALAGRGPGAGDGDSLREDPKRTR